MLNSDDLKDLIVIAHGQSSVAWYRNLKEFYLECLKKNPRTYEEISHTSVIARLIHYAGDSEAEHRNNIAWLEKWDTRNTIRSKAEAWDTIRERCHKALLGSELNGVFSDWASDIAEIQAILATDYSLYETLHRLIPILTDWEWGNGVRGTRAEMYEISNELRARFLAVLQEVRKDERFRLFFVDLDGFTRHIEDEYMLLYGLVRIKNDMDECG